MSDSCFGVYIKNHLHSRDIINKIYSSFPSSYLSSFRFSLLFRFLHENFPPSFRLYFFYLKKKREGIKKNGRGANIVLLIFFSFSSIFFFFSFGKEGKTASENAPAIHEKIKSTMDREWNEGTRKNFFFSSLS